MPTLRTNRSARPHPSRLKRADLLAVERGALPFNQNARLRVALVYPNSYRVGMANLGFQTVYRLFNTQKDVRCERAFVDPDSRIPPCTLETGERLGRFDVVAFSLSFEPDLVHLIRALIESGIPPLAENRSRQDPLVLTGGIAASLNPMPVSIFSDAVVAGEVETVISQLTGILLNARMSKSFRNEAIDGLSDMPGVLIPSDKHPIIRNVTDHLDAHPTYTPVVTPRSHFGDMFVLELGRGCDKGCFFCAACKVYRPCRYRSHDTILKTVAEQNHGSRRIGLEGAGISGYPHLETLAGNLGQSGLELAFSSIRADRVTSGLVDVMETGNVRSITLAPETGTEHLRRQIGKGISDDQMFEAMNRLRGRSIRNLKLYFLIGLPGETESDLAAVVTLVRSMAQTFRANRYERTVRVGVSGFVPKPFTEFQWASMNSEKLIARKRSHIYAQLRNETGIVTIPKSAREESLQGVISLGDEQVGRALLDSELTGMPWKRTLKQQGLSVDKILTSCRSPDEPLPWDVIRYDVPRALLWKRFQKIISNQNVSETTRS